MAKNRKPSWKETFLEIMLAGRNSTDKVYLSKPIVKPLTSPTSVGFFYGTRNIHLAVYGFISLPAKRIVNHLLEAGTSASALLPQFNTANI